MISVSIVDKAGKNVGKYEFDPAELAPHVNRQLMHDVVVMYLANRRVGTVKTKARHDVEGSTRKLYRQKGTGAARAGSIRTPVRRGGGRAFGKLPRDFSYRLPRKAVRLATRMAVLSKFLDDKVIVIDELVVNQPKTKVVAGVLKALGVGESSCLLAIDQHDTNVWKSSRNIAKLCVAPTSELNAYDILRQKRLVMTRSALDRLREQSGKKSSSSPRKKA